MQNGSPSDQQSQENTVSFELYTQAGTSPEDLERLRLECMATVLPCLTGYIWQQDCFTLHSSAKVNSPWNQASVKGARKTEDLSAREHLWGLTRFGDNIEDEWLTVWLLYRITIMFSNISARIWDNDGDFLLIEAAYSLPKWLKPETSKNRVWLHAGQLHIIPLPNKHHPTLPATPTVHQALQIISSDTIMTTANAGMQEAISAKIKQYPKKAQTDMHTARCILPAKVAHVLLHKPQLVSPAVQAFHYRDVQDMRAAANLAHFPPEDLVTIAVPFNRALYAQVAQQQFQPPRGYPLPPPTNPTFKAADLGMKLTCGFEMLMARHKSDHGSRQGHTSEGNGQLGESALKDSPQWAAYKASLAKNGYFQGNIPGSAQYKQLLAVAVQSFTQNEAYEQSVDAAAEPGETIATILQQPVNRDQFKDGPEDDDSWMTGGAADLEAELAQRQKELEGDVAKHAKRTAQGLGATESAPEFDPSEMVSKLNAFVNQTSGHEGAEVPDDMDPNVSFNDPAFWQELKSALGVAADKHGVGLDQLSDAGSSSSDGFSSEEEDNNDDSSSSSEGASGASFSNTEKGDTHTADWRTQTGTSRPAQSSLQTSTGKAPKQQQQRSLQGDSQPHPADVDSGGEGNVSHADCASDVMTATDSDDDDAGFMHAYDQALANELSESRVGSIVPPAVSVPGDANQADPTAAATGDGQAPSNDLKPVDLDTNLVRNLLQSYTAQQGLAGPAGNLAGLLGLHLPDHAEAD